MCVCATHGLCYMIMFAAMCDGRLCIMLRFPPSFEHKLELHSALSVDERRSAVNCGRLPFVRRAHWARGDPHKLGHLETLLPSLGITIPFDFVVIGGILVGEPHNVGKTEMRTGAHEFLQDHMLPFNSTVQRHSNQCNRTCASDGLADAAKEAEICHFGKQDVFWLFRMLQFALGVVVFVMELILGILFGEVAR